MKPTQYNTLMPRVALENLKLIDLDQLVCLIGQNLEGIFSFLINTAYREEIVSTCSDIIEPGLLEEALFQNYAKTFNKLLKDSSKYIKNLLVSVLHKYDALNLKTMLRMVQAGINVDDILQHILPLGTYDRKKCQAILSEVNSISDIVGSLREQDFGFILKEVLKTQKKIGDLSPLEAALDKEVFKGILKEIKNLDGRDKRIATNILGIEIDALNVKIILKFKALMINHEKVKENLMPPALIDEKILESAIKEPDIINYESIKENLMPAALIDEKILESAIKEPEIKSTLQYFLRSVETKHQVYQTVFTKLVRESDSPISHLEFILEKAPLEMSFYELKKNMRYYNIGYILAFLNMKWAEIKNLRCIINSIARNVGAAQTRALLILPENY